MKAAAKSVRASAVFASLHDRLPKPAFAGFVAERQRGPQGAVLTARLSRPTHSGFPRSPGWMRAVADQRLVAIAGFSQSNLAGDAAWSCLVQCATWYTGSAYSVMRKSSQNV